MRIGVDVDGVLANFNRAFIERIVQVTGEDHFPARPFPITTWHYPQDWGYSEQQVSAVWENIEQDEQFWELLAPYPSTMNILHVLYILAGDGEDIYFITSRPGVSAKAQTEQWLMKQGFLCLPTVLISGMKGLCAKALALDIYLDDKDENVEEVSLNAIQCATYLVRRDWNHAPAPGIIGIEEHEIVEVLSHV